jgi:hypothetical protein
MKILLDFSAKVCKEDIFKLTIWNESLHEIINDNWVRVANFATVYAPLQYCNELHDKVLKEVCKWYWTLQLV